MYKILNYILFYLVAVTIRLTVGAIFFHDLVELPQDYEYDYIVVGGGTAGGVVASRLGEKRDWRILVIEAV